MTKSLRRYEVLLPLELNDGTPVPPELNALTLRELREQFGAVSADTQVIIGEWTQGDVVYADRLSRVFVDVPNTAENQRFFRRYKEKLKRRYQQLDMWITTYMIKVV
jgi:hypothetical protein